MPIARVFCDIKTTDGKQFEGDPRYILKRNIEEMKKFGFDQFMVGAGLEGIKQKMQIPPITEENIFNMSSEERAAHKIDTLPAYLYEAINYTRNSALVKKILGEHTFEKFIANKDIEWDNYRTHISSYEIERYLSTL